MVSYEILDENGERKRTERKFEPLAIVRKIRDIIINDDPDRFRIREDDVGTIEIRKLGESLYSAEFGFSEHSLGPSSKFEFRPLPGARQGGTTQQGTPLEEMSGRPAQVAALMKDAFNMLSWEFAELDAASLGNQNLTSYEFEYESSFQLSDVKNPHIEELR